MIGERFMYTNGVTMSDKDEVKKAVPKIAQLRQEKGLTQLKLSQLVGVTVPSIQNWESGRAGIEPIERVIKLCHALKCQAKDLIVPQGVTAKPKANGQYEKI